MSTKPAARPKPLIAPTVEAWRAMTPEERESYLVQVNEWLAAKRTAEAFGEAVALARDALAALRAGIHAVLSARGLSCPEDVRARIEACEAPATLERWLRRAIGASTAAEVVEDR